MLFHTTEFLIFSILLFAFLLISQRDNYRKLVFIFFSYVFYMWWNPTFILLIIASTIIDYVLSHRIYGEERPSRRKLYLWTSIGFNLGVLGFFKYYNFFESNAMWLMRQFGHEPSWTSLHVILPVGISFYTFQTMSYTIDVYRRDIKPASSLMDFVMFVSFFPQLVAGPIVRASDFLPQLKTLRSPFNFQSRYLFLILKGMFKKVIIADNLSLLIDAVFNDPSSYPSIMIVIAAVAFAIQIYCDFSGYTDVAIGIAAVLGFTFPINFYYPYFAKSPSDFWRRWHISLSSWLRDYLYIPLGGNRKGNVRTYVNLFLTMLLGGLWHGASWNFVVWGAFHGLILIVYRMFRIDRFIAAHQSFGTNLIANAVMLYLILISWICFRNADFHNMLVSLQKFIVFDFSLSIQNIGIGTMNFFSTLMIMALFTGLHFFSHRKGGMQEYLAGKSVLMQLSVLVASGMLFFLLWPSKDVPFIYFQF